MNDLKLPYSAIEQFRLLLDALDAVEPIAARAGIETDYHRAYDEWEMIVEAMYRAFIVQPILDTQTVYGFQDFGRLGFSYEGGSERLVFCFEYDGEVLFLHDVALGEDGLFKMLVFRESDGLASPLALSGSKFKRTINVRIVSSKVTTPKEFESLDFRALAVG